MSFFGATWDPLEYSSENFIWTFGPLKLVKKPKYMCKGLNWGLRLEGLGQNLKRGTGTGYDRGTSQNL